MGKIWFSIKILEDVFKKIYRNFPNEAAVGKE